MSNPAERIRLIERSLRCFVYGWLSLIPVIGLVAAFTAIRLHFAPASSTGDEWNPAGCYLKAGCWLARIGILISIAVLALVVMVVMRS